MTNNTSIEVQIHKVDKELNQIIFRPYSSDFKHDSDHYPTRAINITSLDPFRDVKEQLLLLSIPLVREILYKESPEKFDEMLKPLFSQKVENITKEVELKQLFEPHTIFVSELSASQPQDQMITVATEEISSSDSFNVVV